jgi:hypothetical protein
MTIAVSLFLFHERLGFLHQNNFNACSFGLEEIYLRIPKFDPEEIINIDLDQ